MTRRFSLLFAYAVAGLLVTTGLVQADPTNSAPDFKEVYDLLRANLPGATDETLNRAAVEGLLSRFPGQVSLAGGAAGGPSVAASRSALGQSGILENNVAYLRINQVTAGLATELGAATRALAATNPVSGTVLDLRFAVGDDYAAAQAAAELWTSKKASHPVGRPLVILVNGGTSGAAEALATALRTADVALVIGSPTAGAAATFKAFVLKDGERLLIASTPAGPADKAPAGGVLKPDITVAVSPDAEREFWKNPYGAPAAGHDNSRLTTNVFLPFVDHTSEADLVREKIRDAKSGNLPPGLAPSRAAAPDDDEDSGDEVDSSSPSNAGPPRAILRDPVLARAVDLVKGLSVMREVRP